MSGHESWMDDESWIAGPRIAFKEEDIPHNTIIVDWGGSLDDAMTLEPGCYHLQKVTLPGCPHHSSVWLAVQLHCQDIQGRVDEKIQIIGREGVPEDGEDIDSEGGELPVLPLPLQVPQSHHLA